MIQASAKNVVRMAIALGAFALAALVAMPNAPRSAADGFGGAGTFTPTPTPAPAFSPPFPFAFTPTPTIKDALTPTPAPKSALTPTPKAILDFGANGKSAVPSATPKPSIDGKENLSPDIFGGAKMPPVYANLEASLENVAVLAAKGAGGAMGAADAAMNAEMVADAVAQTPLNDGATAVAVSVYAQSDISDAKRFLENLGVRIDYSGQTWLEAYVPAHFLGPLSERAGVIRVEPIVPPVVDQAPPPASVPDQDPDPSPSPTPTPGPCDPIDLGTLSANVSRASSWDEDCLSSTRTGSYARFYKFAIASDSVFEYVEVETSDDSGTGKAAEPFAYLRKGDATSGDAIAEYRERGSNRRIGNVALDAGTYTVEAATLQAGSDSSLVSKSFTLKMPYSEPTICAADTTIGTISTSTTTTKTGTWTDSCDSGGNKGSAKHYEFTLSQATALTIDLTTDTGADPILYVRKNDPEDPDSNTFGRGYIARDDNSGSGTSARIIQAFAAGTYTVEAAARGSVNNKAFTLSLTSELATICRDPLSVTSSPTTETASWASGCDSATNPRQFRALLHIQPERRLGSDDRADHAGRGGGG